MQLGAFSISLTVQNLEVSKTFYEKLGFSAIGGDIAQNYLIMQNGTTLIGLFHGMFDKNILTFNPGWDHNAEEVNPYTDVRDIQQALSDKGIAFEAKADANSKGPAHFIVVDPDGNPILVDQHR